MSNEEPSKVFDDTSFHQLSNTLEASMQAQPMDIREFMDIKIIKPLDRLIEIMMHMTQDSKKAADDTAAEGRQS